MDPRSCQSGYYTDRAFQDVPLDECSTPIWVFWTCTMVLCGLRFVAFFKKIDNYLKNPHYAGPQKYPVSLFSHFFAAVMYLIVVLAIGTNAANVDNGISFSLYSLGYLSFIINYSVLLVRTVRLGKRLIPKPVIENRDLAFLSKFNSLGLMLIAIQSFAALVSCIALIIVSPVAPNEDIILGGIGFATKGVFQLLCILGIVMQFQRCILALQAFRSSQGSFSAPLAEREYQLNRTIQIMRQRQMTIFALGGGVSVIYLIFAARLVPWTWAWIFIGTAGVETIGSLVIEFCFSSGSKRSKTDQPSAAGAFNSTNRTGQVARDDAQIVASGPTPQAVNSRPPQIQPSPHQAAYTEDDEVSELPSKEVTMTRPRKTYTRTKLGPMGFRLKRKPKPEIDLTKVTEEQSYMSSMNPTASTMVLRASLSADLDSSGKVEGSDG